LNFKFGGRSLLAELSYDNSLVLGGQNLLKLGLLPSIREANSLQRDEKEPFPFIGTWTKFWVRSLFTGVQFSPKPDPNIWLLWLVMTIWGVGTMKASFKA
jgi:hypothetical protein